MLMFPKASSLLVMLSGELLTAGDRGGNELFMIEDGRKGPGNFLRLRIGQQKTWNTLKVGKRNGYEDFSSNIHQQKFKSSIPSGVINIKLKPLLRRLSEDSTIFFEDALSVFSDYVLLKNYTDFELKRLESDWFRKQWLKSEESEIPNYDTTNESTDSHDYIEKEETFDEEEYDFGKVENDYSFSPKSENDEDDVEISTESEGNTKFDDTSHSNLDWNNPEKYQVENNSSEATEAEAGEQEFGGFDEYGSTYETNAFEDGESDLENITESSPVSDVFDNEKAFYENYETTTIITTTMSTTSAKKVIPAPHNVGHITHTGVSDNIHGHLSNLSDVDSTTTPTSENGTSSSHEPQISPLHFYHPFVPSHKKNHGHSKRLRRTRSMFRNSRPLITNLHNIQRLFSRSNRFIFPHSNLPETKDEASDFSNRLLRRKRRTPSAPPLLSMPTLTPLRTQATCEVPSAQDQQRPSTASSLRDIEEGKQFLLMRLVLELKPF